MLRALLILALVLYVPSCGRPAGDATASGSLPVTVPSDERSVATDDVSALVKPVITRSHKARVTRFDHAWVGERRLAYRSSAVVFPTAFPYG
jgi:hypothetical protein